MHLSQARLSTEKVGCGPFRWVRLGVCEGNIFQPSRMSAFKRDIRQSVGGPWAASKATLAA